MARQQIRFAFTSVKERWPDAFAVAYEQRERPVSYTDPVCPPFSFKARHDAKLEQHHSTVRVIQWYSDTQLLWDRRVVPAQVHVVVKRSEGHPRCLATAIDVLPSDAKRLYNIKTKKVEVCFQTLHKPRPNSLQAQLSVRDSVNDGRPVATLRGEQ